MKPKPSASCWSKRCRLGCRSLPRAGAEFQKLWTTDKPAILVEPHDIGGVAERLEQLHADPALREQMGAKAREKFLSEFTVGMFWQRMEQVFLETAGA